MWCQTSSWLCFPNRMPRHPGVQLQSECCCKGAGRVRDCTLFDIAWVGSIGRKLFQHVVSLSRGTSGSYVIFTNEYIVQSSVEQEMGVAMKSDLQALKTLCLIYWLYIWLFENNIIKQGWGNGSGSKSACYESPVTGFFPWNFNFKKKKTTCGRTHHPSISQHG